MKEKKVAFGSSILASAGSVAALFTSLCCAGPAVLALIGAGGAAVAAGLAPFRPYLLFGSLCFLAIGFWRLYRPSMSAGQSCPIRSGKSLKTVLWSSFALWMASAILFAAPNLSHIPESAGPISTHAAIGSEAASLRDAFNADIGKLRIVMLVSPT